MYFKQNYLSYRKHNKAVMRKLLGLALVCMAGTSFAQDAMTYKYTDNKTNLKLEEDIYTPKSSGVSYVKRVEGFMKMADSTRKQFLNREGYTAYIGMLNDAAKNNVVEGQYTRSKVAAFVKTIQDLGNLESTADYRYTLYAYSYPVYKALSEAWEDEIVNAAIADGYMDLVGYVTQKSIDDNNLKTAMSVIYANRSGLGADNGKCSYTVNVNSNILKKEEVQVVFCNDAIYRRAAGVHTGKLLEGPVVDWKSHEGESNSMYNIVKHHGTYASHTGQHTYITNMNASKQSQLVQPLDRSEPWFILVFRNNVLYYSYMIAPCGKRNSCNIN